MSFFKSLGSFLSPMSGSRVQRGLGLKYDEPNPANSAMPYLNQIPGIGRQNLDPFIQRGQQAEGRAPAVYDQMYNEAHNMPDLYQNNFPQEYGSMAKNPTEFLDNIMKSYKPSEGYKYKQGKLLGAARNSAASGGFAGTQYDQDQQANMVNGILGGDMQEFLNNILGIQGQGLQGQERQLAGRERGQERQMLGQQRALAMRGANEEATAQRGFDAAQALADLLGNTASAQGGVAYQGQRQRNQGRMDARQNRLDFLGQLLGGIRGRG